MANLGCSPIADTTATACGWSATTIARGGYNWSKRYPWIVESALNNRHERFRDRREAVILGVDGISDFDALHSGPHNDEVQLCAFDILTCAGCS